MDAFALVWGFSVSLPPSKHARARARIAARTDCIKDWM